MFNKFLKLHSGKKSTNIQAGKDIVFNGSSYLEVKEICLDLFKQSLPELRAEAAAIANERAEFISQKLFYELWTKNPEAITRLNQPDMQYNLVAILKEYARNGDQQLGNMLIELFIKLTLQSNKNLIQVNLQEAVAVLPRMTVDQLNVLVLKVLLRFPSFDEGTDFSYLIEYLKNKVCPFVDFDITESDIKYLEYLGCIRRYQFQNETYPDLSCIFSGGWGYYYDLPIDRFFSKGLSRNDLGTFVFDGTNKNCEEILIQCFHDPQKLQLDTYNHLNLSTIAREKNIQMDKFNTLIERFRQVQMPQNEINELLINAIPSISKFFEVSDKLHVYEITYVAAIIVQVYYKTKTNADLDISYWTK